MIHNVVKHITFSTKHSNQKTGILASTKIITNILVQASYFQKSSIQLSNSECCFLHLLSYLVIFQSQLLKLNQLNCSAIKIQIYYGKLGCLPPHKAIPCTQQATSHQLHLHRIPKTNKLLKLRLQAREFISDFYLYRIPITNMFFKITYLKLGLQAKEFISYFHLH